MFEELDVAERVLIALARRGKPSRKLEDAIDECRSFATSHAEMFLAACRLLVALGHALDPNLGDRDPDLALSIDKWVMLLDAIEEVEALSTAPVFDLGAAPETARPSLRERLLDALKGAADALWETFCLPIPLPALARIDARGATPVSRYGGLQWSGRGGAPTGKIFARLPPAPADAHDEADDWTSSASAGRAPRTPWS